MPRKRPSNAEPSKSSAVQEFRFISAIPDSDNERHRLRTVVRSNATKWQWSQSRTGVVAEIGPVVEIRDSIHPRKPSSHTEDSLRQSSNDLRPSQNNENAAPVPRGGGGVPVSAGPHESFSGGESWAQSNNDYVYTHEFHLQNFAHEQQAGLEDSQNREALPEHYYDQEDIDQALRDFTNEAFQDDISTTVLRFQDDHRMHSSRPSIGSPSNELRQLGLNVTLPGASSSLPSRYSSELSEHGTFTAVV